MTAQSRLPVNPQAILFEALQHHRTGRFGEAEKLYRHILAIQPGAAEVHINLAAVLMSQGNLDAALCACERGLELKPDYAKGYCLKGDILAFQNRLDGALLFYRQALARRPGYAEALNGQGNAFLRQGMSDDAIVSYQQAVLRKPDFHEAFNNLGQALLLEGRFEAARAAFEKAIRANPGYAEAHNNIGWLLLQQRKPDEAEDAFRKAIAVRPHYAQALLNLGAALGGLDRLEEAAIYCRRAVAADPDYSEAAANLGYVLQKQGHLGEAETYFRRAIALKPDFLQAHEQLGVVLCESHRISEAFVVFNQLAHLKHAGKATGASASPHKLRHDEEQRKWRGLEAGDGAFHLDQGSRVDGPAVNPANAVSQIGAHWRTAQPQIVVIDDLLTPGALDKLRHFCMASTVWEQSYEGGYLGAFPEHGFAPPLLAQIAEELRAVFPQIIEDHPLLHFWAFKYDSSLYGIKKHADFAAVNVNFWITPNEANLDPEHGGLVVWDKAAPLDWDFAKYNAADQDIGAFLEEQNARPITIPYRANRAVIFDSDLFHETDAIRFKPGYENRRINVTLLFGRRQTQRIA